jgi:uncharacterized protein YggE
MKKATYLALLFCFISLATYAQEASGRIEVTGHSAAEELPKELTINIPLVVIDSTYLSCSNELNTLLTNLKKDLESKGIERKDLSTGSYAISENFEYKQGERKRMGFKGQVTLTLRKQYEPEIVDDFLQVANKFSLQYTIRFMLTEEQKEKLSRAAMVQAVDDAKRKAEILTEASGVRLGSISKITYGESQGRPGPLMEVVRMSADGSSTDSNGLKLYPSEISVHQSVNIIWMISN